MKNLHRGSAIPLIIAIIAILAVGGVYVYENKKTEIPPLVNNKVPELDQVQQQTSVEKSPSLKVYQNSKYKFSVQYPQAKYISDSQPRDNGIYLRPIVDTTHFYKDNVALIFNANSIKCSSLASYKKPDGQTLTVGPITFQHVSEVVKNSKNDLLDTYEVFDKYFYTKNNTCYSAILNTYTFFSKLDKANNKILSEKEIQDQWKEINREVDAYKSDFKKIIESFELL